MKYINHRRARTTYNFLNAYKERDLWDFASDFYYGGNGFVDRRNCFGDLWCESVDTGINRDGDEEIIIRCWYTKSMPSFGKRSREPDLVIAVIVDPYESGCDTYYWVHKRVLKWNSKWRSRLVKDKLLTP